MGGEDTRGGYKNVEGSGLVRGEPVTRIDRVDTRVEVSSSVDRVVIFEYR